MKSVRLSQHAKEQAIERRTNATEIIQAIEKGSREPAKHDREHYRWNIPFNGIWNDKFYAIKQVSPVVKEEETEIVVITVYTFYF